MRVEQLAAESGLSVDTVRYYQSKGLLDPPRREGRLAWYDESHLARLDRIRGLRDRGFTLATIARLVSGDLDAADEALIAELAGTHPPGVTPPTLDDTASDSPSEDGLLTLEELAAETGLPLALLAAVQSDGLLVPHRIGGQDRYDAEDVAAAKAGLLLLEWGIPLSELLDLARHHHEATEAVARQAVELFSRYVRHPIRDSAADEPASEDGSSAAERLVQAYAELLPAVDTLVRVHFVRTLVRAALEHVEQSGSDAERQAVISQVGRTEQRSSEPAGRSAPAFP
jgi:DNA-binding transcriptional MerR regulator